MRGACSCRISSSASSGIVNRFSGSIVGRKLVQKVQDKGEGVSRQQVVVFQKSKSDNLVVFPPRAMLLKKKREI